MSWGKHRWKVLIPGMSWGKHRWKVLVPGMSWGKLRWKVLIPGMSWRSAVKMYRSRNEMEKKSNLVPRMIRKGAGRFWFLKWVEEAQGENSGSWNE
jgi:hypothetical protein